MRVWAKGECGGVSVGTLETERGREYYNASECEHCGRRGRVFGPAGGMTSFGANEGRFANGIGESGGVAELDAGSDTEAVSAGGSPFVQPLSSELQNVINRKTLLTCGPDLAFLYCANHRHRVEWLASVLGPGLPVRSLHHPVYEPAHTRKTLCILIKCIGGHRRPVPLGEKI
jgi:hypothetical protein